MIINSDTINKIIHRSQAGFQYHADGPVVFYALQHAVTDIRNGTNKKNVGIEDYVKKGLEIYNQKRADEAAKEH